MHTPLRFSSASEKNVASLSDVTLRKGIVWLNVQNVAEKLALLERVGRWRADQTRMEREQSSLYDSSTAVELLSDRS